MHVELILQLVEGVDFDWQDFNLGYGRTCKRLFMGLQHCDPFLQVQLLI